MTGPSSMNSKVEKICSHCGATILVGLQYCPSCLHSVGSQRKNPDQAVAVAIAPDAQGTRLERLQSKWDDFVSWLSFSSTPMPVGKDDPSFAYKTGDAGATSMSEAYTRVVCPSCHRPNRAPLNQSQSGRVMCTSCFHQFPASLADEFRKGADLNCFHCGVITFCVNGLKVNQCPNCKTQVVRPRDPEKAKLIALAGVVASLLLIGFGHAVATQTTSQFLLWLVIGSIFTFLGFIVLIALGL